MNSTINEQTYWYMGEPVGFMFVGAVIGVKKIRTYAVLVGF